MGHNLKTILAGIAIALVIILSSVPFVKIGDVSEQYQLDGFCTETHQKDEGACKADKEHGCVWCIARAVPSMCYDLETAEELPHSVFKCQFSFKAEVATELKTD